MQPRLAELAATSLQQHHGGGSNNLLLAYSDTVFVQSVPYKLFVLFLTLYQALHLVQIRVCMPRVSPGFCLRGHTTIRAHSYTAVSRVWYSKSLVQVLTIVLTAMRPMP
eukprot:602304-Rhodomonas_salina.2